MTKYKLKDIIKKSIKPLITEQTTPNSHRKMYMTICSIGPLPNPPGWTVGATIVTAHVNGIQCNGQMCTDTGPGSDPANPNPAGTGDIGMTFQTNMQGIKGVLVDILNPMVFSGGEDMQPDICPGPPVPGCTNINSTANNYDPLATVDDGSCEGCTDPNASNYDPFFNNNTGIDDGSCYYNPGCMDGGPTDYTMGSGFGSPADGITANNYDPAADFDDGSCTYDTGCTDQSSCNYTLGAIVDDGSCEYTSCAGCTDPGACNYDSTAFFYDGTPNDDGSCDYSCLGCTDTNAINFDPNATSDDGSCYGCMHSNYTNHCVGCNYDCANSSAGTNISCCLLDGCTDPNACNYQIMANNDDGSCEYTSCAGCTDPGAINFNQNCAGQNVLATIDDGCCEYIEGCADPTAIPCSQMPPSLQNSTSCYEANHQGCGNPPDSSDHSCCKYEARDREVTPGCTPPPGGCPSGHLWNPYPACQCLSMSINPDNDVLSIDRDIDIDPPEPGPCDEFFNTNNPGQQASLCGECFHALNNGFTFSNSGLSTDDNCSCCKGVDFVMPLKEMLQKRAGIKK